MSVAIVTGGCGLVGTEACLQFHELGYDVIAIDNDSRKSFFGEEGSISENLLLLKSKLTRFSHRNIDIRDNDEVVKIFKEFSSDIAIVIHSAAQPSHDLSADMPIEDFKINALGTLHLLEACRQHAPDATFIHVSTNKVYGNRADTLPLIANDMRFNLKEDHPFYQRGFDETLPIDQSFHSVFGVSKTAGDLMAQEYRRRFGLNTAVFRCGCITGRSQQSVKLHGFLSYLAKSLSVSGTYEVIGHRGKQVRDNIHSYDLVKAFSHFHQKSVASENTVYNIGGGFQQSCSVLEAVALFEKLTSKRVDLTFNDELRPGDPKWLICDYSKFQTQFPDWSITYSLERVMDELLERFN